MRYRKIILTILSLFLCSSILCTSVLAEEEHPKPGFFNYFIETFENSELNLYAKDVDGDGLTWKRVSDGKGHHGTGYMTSPSSSDAGFSEETKNELVSITVVADDGDILEFYISAKDPSKVGDKVSVYEINEATDEATLLGEFTTTANWQKHEVKLFRVDNKNVTFKFVQEANENNSGINLDCVRVWRAKQSNKYPEVKPTCTEDGHKAYYNPVGTEYYFEDLNFTTMIPDLDAWLKGDGLIKATGHTMTHHERIEPTFDSYGSKEYYECGVCGKKFADEEGLVPLEDTSIPRIENALEDPNQYVLYNPNYEYSNEIVIKNHNEKYVDSITGFNNKCYVVAHSNNDLTKSRISFKNECLGALGAGVHNATVKFHTGNDVDIEIVVPEYVKLEFKFPGHDYFPGIIWVDAESFEYPYGIGSETFPIYVPKGNKVNLELESFDVQLIDYKSNGVELADEFVASSDMVITVNTRANISSLSMKPTSHDFGKAKVGYTPIDAYEFVIENDGENDLALGIPELKNYEIVDIKVIDNPNADPRPVFLGEYYEEEGIVFLDLGDKLVLKVKPKDALAVGKYNEELKIEAYHLRMESTLGEDDDEERIPFDVTVKSDLSFEVVDKQLDNVPETNDSTNITLYGAISISSLAIALYLIANRKRQNIK